MRSSPPPKLSAAPRSKPSIAASAIGPSIMGTAKGFYFRAILKELADQGHHLTSTTSYRDFGDYPLSAARELLIEAAQRMYPGERRPEGMRRLGWIIYPTLLQTIVGKVIFASLGNDVQAVLRNAGRGFEVSVTQGRYEAVRIGERDADVSVRAFPIYPESFLVGVFEGVLAHYGHTDSKVTVRVLSINDVDLHLKW